MSHWTHVRGLVAVSSRGRTQPECRYVLETVLDHLPLVTGSEGDMDVHIVQAAGHSMSSNLNEFDERSEAIRKRPWWIDDGQGRIQDHYFLVLEGDLRDREFEETKREMLKWLTRLSKRLLVDSVLVVVNGDYRSGPLLINNSEAFEDMYEWKWNYKTDETQKTWTDYLIWKRYGDSSYPQELVEYYIEQGRWSE